MVHASCCSIRVGATARTEPTAVGTRFGEGDCELGSALFTQSGPGTEPESVAHHEALVIRNTARPVAVAPHATRYEVRQSVVGRVAVHVVRNQFPGARTGGGANNPGDGLRAPMARVCARSDRVVKNGAVFSDKPRRSGQRVIGSEQCAARAQLVIRPSVPFSLARSGAERFGTADMAGATFERDSADGARQLDGGPAARSRSLSSDRINLAGQP